jgi:hypothetical protein
MLLTLAAKHRPWLRTVRCNPQCKAISVEVCGTAGYLPKMTTDMSGNK